MSQLWSEIAPQAYFWFKAFHIIGVVVWFAGLFYLVRLFVYHAEAEQEPEPAKSILKKQYELMETRLYSIITAPGMMVTVVMAIALLTTEPGILKFWWLHAKLALVACLLVYHFYCRHLMKKLAAGTCEWTGQQFRALNEAPTLLLVTIVMLAVFKNNLPLNWTGGLILALIVFMAAAIQLYAKKRRKDQEKLTHAQSQVSKELLSNS